MSAIDFYIQGVTALDEIDASYVIVGAFTGLAFGVSRATFDVDILVDLQGDDCEKLSNANLLIRLPLIDVFAGLFRMQKEITSMRGVPNQQISLLAN